MTKERKLQILHEALEDWKEETNNFTCIGFCWYFTHKLKLDEELKKILKVLKRSLGLKGLFLKNDYFWLESGATVTGKAKRIALIEKTIKRLENKI